MRLGGPVFEKYEGPDQWAGAIKKLGYRAAYCPVGPDAPNAEAGAYAVAAKAADIVIAEVGAWSNPLSPDEPTRKAALEKCKNALALAERMGIRCCVNIAGSRGPQWDGPSALDLTDETFELIVTCVRDIIDAVKPGRTFYTLEPMPWMYPDSVESYLKLIKAMDRPAFAVHFDPVNLVNCPARYFKNSELIKDFVARLGPYIKSVHVKDILLADRLTTHLDEVRPGLGALDTGTLLQQIHALPEDIPVMLEHLPDAREYSLAADHIRGVAKREGITL